jgi:hypothetical protein
MEPAVQELLKERYFKFHLTISRPRLVVKKLGVADIGETVWWWSPRSAECELPAAAQSLQPFAWPGGQSVVGIYTANIPRPALEWQVQGYNTGESRRRSALH